MTGAHSRGQACARRALSDLGACQPGVVLMLHYLKRHPPFDTDAGRSELLERLKRIQGLELRGGMDGMPRVPFAALTHERALAKLFELLDWLIERIRVGA